MRKFAFLILFFIILNGCGSNIEIKEKQTTVPSSETDSYVENTLAGIVITFTDSNNVSQFLAAPTFCSQKIGFMIFGYFSAYCFTIALVQSVLQSSPIITSNGKLVSCIKKPSIAFPIYFS